MSIFQKSVINSIKQDESLIALRWAQYQNYLSKIDFIKTVKEEKYQDGFLKDIFEACLGYTLDSTNPANFNLEREKKNETDGKKADGVIYVNNEIVGIVELKDQKTKNLDAVEGQAFNYHNSHSNSKYIIISNFNELRFYIDKKTMYEKFNLFSLSYEDFKMLHLLLSFESIRDNVPLKLKEKSANFEQTISKELYRDFSQFRSHLFENIIKNNDLDRSLLLRLTQKLCDRIIFILFAEDRNLLKANTVKEIRLRHAADGFGDRSMYDYYKLYFNAINTGNDKLGIPKYNGGLFATDELLESLIIDDTYLDMEAQKLSDFDFESDISVNILGHIFEQSLTDLEEMNATISDTEFDKKKSKRKKDGVFYTPEYITRYIVENTLGKLCTDKKKELKIEPETVVVNPRKLTKAEQNYKETLIAYREWLTHLKILDPACGSGAFLNQALEFLIREHTLIRDLLLPYEDLMIGYEIEKSILEHNLYGVDINEDAVEIAKLSLWLRTAHKGRELTSLNDKIVCANSLLAMPFEEGSFDVVIGNPPYVALNKIKDVDYSRAGFEVFEKTGDLLALFIEKGLRLTADGKYFSFIVSNSWLKTKYGEPLKRFLEKNGQTQVLNFVGTQLFEDATVESCIVSSICHFVPIPVRPEPVEGSGHGSTSSPRTEITITNIRNFTTQNASVETITEAIANSAGDDGELLLMRKIESIGKPLKEWEVSINRGILTGFNEAFIIDTAKRDELVARDPKSAEIIKPILRGRDVQRYVTNWAEQWMIATFPSLKISIDEYLVIKRYLESFGARLEQSGEAGSRKKTSNQWFETQDQISYWQNFDKPKIIWGEISDEPKFAYDDNSYFMNDTLFMMTGENLKYLLAFLNSKLSKWYFERISTTTGMGTNRWKKFKLELLPIAIADDEAPCINFVDEILSAKETLKKYKKHFDKLSANDKIEIIEETEKLEVRVVECEKEIDAMVYVLYGLNKDEIAIVEGR
ncbi:MAG: TaqI-like C-terminal specificity domain-containing protein [Sulfuricurvum sp.]|nr:TaqI-like C-terminal specificity domain-containing protein [Sulfuricurvum sp.]